MLLASASVRADEGKRSSLKSEIERLLQDMAGELRDVPGDASTSDLERTIGYAGSVYDKARELRDHADGDSDARRWRTTTRTSRGATRTRPATSAS